MAIRTDMVFDMEVSPRLVTIDAPSTSITIQDLHDTLVDFEDSTRGHQFGRVILSEGKTDLGGGLSVGITAILQNTQLAFEARTLPTENGTATTANAAGTILIDSAATFITNGVQRGAEVFNCTDASLGSVLSIDSEIQVTMIPLAGGPENDWDIGDVYVLYNIEDAVVTGGNLTAVDPNQVAIDPIFPTAHIRVDIEKSTSSSAIGEVVSLTPLVELAQAAPPALPTWREALMLVYMTLRNQLDVDASFKKVYNDAGTAIAKKPTSDDGTTYSEDKMQSGP